MEFKVRETLTKRDVAGTIHVSRLARDPRWRKLRRVLCAAAGLWLCWSGAHGAYVTAVGWDELANPAVSVTANVLMLVAPCLLLIWAGVVLFLSALERHPFSVWFSWHARKEWRDELRFVFQEEDFTVHTDFTGHRYQYSVVRRIVEDGERYYLFTARQEALTLRKSDLKGGDPAAFHAFLEKKTGVSAEKIA